MRRMESFFVSEDLVAYNFASHQGKGHTKGEILGPCCVNFEWSEVCSKIKSWTKIYVSTSVAA